MLVGQPVGADDGTGNGSGEPGAVGTGGAITGVCGAPIGVVSAAAGACAGCGKPGIRMMSPGIKPLSALGPWIALFCGTLWIACTPSSDDFP